MFRELGIGENLFAEFQSISVLLVFITSLRTYERKNLNTKQNKQKKKKREGEKKKVISASVVTVKLRCVMLWDAV